MSHTGEVILGLLGTAFFTLLWRRLDSIDKRLERMETRLEKVGDTVMEVKGRMDEISKHV